MSDHRRPTSLARDAALLLPAPPRAGDPALYLAWEQLVWFTAGRLADVLGAQLDSVPRENAPVVPCTAVSWQTLLTLAASSRPSQTGASEQGGLGATAGRRPTAARHCRVAARGLRAAYR